MRRYSRGLALSLALAVLAIFQVGCGGSGGSSSFNVHTRGPAGAWPNATIYGTADPSNSPCNPATDPNCYESFGPKSTDSSGNYVEYTDALPDSWKIAAEADNNCPSGGDVGWTNVGKGGNIDVDCGAFANGIVCTINYLNNVQQNTCPTTLVITGSDYPTTYSLDAGAYDPSGNSVESYQGTASSTTQFSVPAPSGWGIHVITVWDPTNNTLLAATSYTLHECFTVTNDYGSSTNCPY